MADGISRRVRRPIEKAELLDRLNQADSPFRTYRDSLVFAAGLGWWRCRRVPFDTSSEPIHWATMIAKRGTEPLVNMLAVAETQGLEILAGERLGDRIKIFEEYANGGLEVLQALLRDSPKRVVDVVRELVSQAVAEGGSVKVIPLADHADELD